MDLIERKAAIDAVLRAEALVRAYGYRYAADALRELPSVQPQRSLDEWCQDCKEYDQERHCCPRFNQVIRQTLDERKTGKWIEDAETYYRAVNEKGGGVNENTPYFTDDIACSECLAKFSVIDNEAERFDFCPNCGSYNGGAE